MNISLPETLKSFIDALEKAYTHIGRHAASGSPRYSHELNLPGMRCWPLTHYPHLVFYVDRADHIDVWRVLHGERDIPSWLQEAGNRTFGSIDLLERVVISATDAIRPNSIIAERFTDSLVLFCSLPLCNLFCQQSASRSR